MFVTVNSLSTKTLILKTLSSTLLGTVQDKVPPEDINVFSQTVVFPVISFLVTFINNVFVDNELTVTNTVKLEGGNYGVVGYLIFLIIAISFILIMGESKTGVLLAIGISFTAALGFNLISGSLLGIGASGLWLIVLLVVAIWKLNKDRQS